MTKLSFFFLLIPILGIILLAVTFLLAPHEPYKEKETPFECGYHSFLQTRTQFAISFFIFGLLFLLFDLEIVLIYPYSASSLFNNIYGLISIVIFILVLTLGFVFEIGKKALKIDSKDNDDNNILIKNVFSDWKHIVSIIVTSIFFSYIFLYILRILNINISYIIVMPSLIIMSLIKDGLSSTTTDWYLMSIKVLVFTLIYMGKSVVCNFIPTDFYNEYDSILGGGYNIIDSNGYALSDNTSSLYEMKECPPFLLCLTSTLFIEGTIPGHNQKWLYQFNPNLFAENAGESSNQNNQPTYEENNPQPSDASDPNDVYEGDVSEEDDYDDDDSEGQSNNLNILDDMSDQVCEQATRTIYTVKQALVAWEEIGRKDFTAEEMPELYEKEAKDVNDNKVAEMERDIIKYDSESRLEYLQELTAKGRELHKELGDHLNTLTENVLPRSSRREEEYLNDLADKAKLELKDLDVEVNALDLKINEVFVNDSRDSNSSNNPD